MVMEQCKKCESEDKFVCVVTACPEPMCLLATDKQLHDLVRFATNPNRFCALSIDPTFSLGHFSVTRIAYRNLLVTDTRTGKSPVMLGPMLVHQRKSYATYHFFVSTLLGVAPGLSKILAFGTDGEEALVKAFKQQLPFAVHLRCFHHMKQDIHRKLSVDMGYPNSTVSEIIAHIFGRKEGPIFLEGLVDSCSEAEYDTKLCSLRETWDKLEGLRTKKCEKITFFLWFKIYHAEEIKSTMLRSVREAAGLGDPPSQFGTNDSESINFALKHFLGFKKSDWPIFNDKMRKFILNQQEEVSKSIVGLGQYRPREEYQHLSIAPSRWFHALSEEQKKNAQKKLEHVTVDDRQEECSFVQSNEKLDDVGQLSVGVESAAEVTGLPTLVLRQMWSKATDLVFSDSKVMPAPGSSKTSRMVASAFHEQPHFVVYTQDGRFKCDNNCPAFLQSHICSHSIAAAESNGLLKDFLKNDSKYAKTPKGSEMVAPNFTRMSMVNLPRRTAGCKGGKAPVKKAIARKKGVPSEQRRPLEVNNATTPEGAPSNSASHSAATNDNNPSCSYSNSGAATNDSVAGCSYSGVTNDSVAGCSYSGAATNDSIAGCSYSGAATNDSIAGCSYSGAATNDSSYPYSGAASNDSIASCSYYPERDPHVTPYDWNWQSPSFTSYPPYTYQPPFPPFYLPYPEHPDRTSGSSFQSPSGSGISNSKSSNPFEVKLLNGRIKVCAGCKGPHMKGANNEVHVLPPYDICIGHREPLNFINPRTGLESSKLGNAYYHVNIVCIRKKHSNFTPSQLMCSESLKDVHFKFLEDTLKFKMN